MTPETGSDAPENGPETGPETGTAPDADAAPAANLRTAAAADLFAQIPEIADDMEARPDGEDSLPYLHQLLRGETPEEAVTFAAYMLLPRHAVWWGHECLQAVPDILTDEDREMLSFCAAWAADPQETARNAALEAGMAVGTPGPGAWLALAAGWSEGSMAPADQPEVPPAPFLTGRAVNAAVLTGLARVAQDDRNKRLAHFVSMADYLAKGG